MSGIIFALITVLAWGAWLAPSQNVPFKNQQVKTFYVASANLVLAFIVLMVIGPGQLTLAAFWPSFLGGLMWSVSGLCAFTATHKIGMARAFGIWAPFNIMISILWGAVIFNEFIKTSPLSLLLMSVSLGVILAGVSLIIFARGAGGNRGKKADLVVGFLCALGAGILWGTYYIPLKVLGVSSWIGAFPLAVGIFAGSVLLLLLSRSSPRLERPAHYLRVSATGLMWGIGNYGMLLLVDQLGAGKGFTISQLSVVVNGLVGVYILKDPHPRSRAALLTLVGCVLATLGGIILGNLK
jgi:glucose uptake protein